MTAASGRFFSAQDAEVDAREGASYVWTGESFGAALQAGGLQSDLTFAESLYGIDQGSNFRDPHHQDAEPTNVLFLAAKPAEDDFAQIDQINATLLTIRDQRKQPITDDKTLAGWNGLMIAGFAEGGRVLKEERYLDAARNAATFILEEMRGKDGTLQRTYRDGRASIDAFLEDYAFLVHGLFRLHQATGEARWLTEALNLIDEAEGSFADSVSGGFFDSRAGQTDLFVRLRSRYDGATPSGNSQMLVNLITAHRVTGNERYLKDASTTLASMSQRIRDYPTALLVAMRGVDELAREHPAYMPDGEAMRNDTSQPVQVHVDPQASDGRINIRLTIAEGFHVNAHEPGDPNLVGLELVLVGEGLELDVDYPSGTAFTAAFSDQAILVHSQSVEFSARVRRVSPSTDTPRLILKWQACNDQVCLAPAEEILRVEF